MGVGGALIMPATLSILTNVFPPDERAARSASGPASPASGSPSARSSAACCSALLVGLGLPRERAGRHRGPDPRPPDRARLEGPVAERLDPVGAVLSIVGLVSWSTRSSRRRRTAGPRRRRSSRSPSPSSCSPSSRSGSCAATTRCSTSSSSRTHGSRPRASRSCCVLRAVRLLFFLTQYLQFVLGYTPLQAGLRVAPSQSC